MDQTVSRDDQREAAKKALATAEEEHAQIKYTSVSRLWWQAWRSWIANQPGANYPGNVVVLEPNDKNAEDLCWLPTSLVQTLVNLNGKVIETDVLATGVKLTNSRWDLSWSYAEPNSCWCCGGPGADLQCSGCDKARYCSKRCQQIHWMYSHSVHCTTIAEEMELVIEEEFRRWPRGLANLGNSCFMNATVQCLVAARPLLKYFLRDEWQDDLREKHRNVAVAFADLCKQLAFCEDGYVNPSQLKQAVSKLSTGLFAGYQQNDAEELLLFLLDTLHEDLDVVKDKGHPPKEDEDQWSAHRRREHSFIDALTLGSYETCTKCSNCGHSSTKTDVFKHLNLALPPNTADRVILVVVVRQADHEKLKKLPQRCCQTRYAVQLSKDATCETFQREIARASRVNFEKLLFVSVERGTVAREILPSMPLKKVPSPSLSGDVLVVAYELGTTANDPARKAITPDPVDEKKKGEDFEMKLDEDDDRHIICMFARGKRVERVIPICVTFSASRDTVKDVVAKLAEAVARSTSDRDISFYLSEVDGRYHDNQEKLSATSNMLFVDYVGGPALKSGRLKICFVICVRQPNVIPLKIEFQEHESCHRLKEQIANETKGESVLSCLQHFVQPTTLDKENGWRCPKCSVVVPASQMVRFTRLPEVLILVLKRFDIMEGKITSLVRFDVENMDLTEFLTGMNVKEESHVYDLFAVVNHYGSMVGGHYTAFVGRDVTDTQPAAHWDEIDDSKRLDLRKEHVVSPAAYILFFRKRVAPL